MINGAMEVAIPAAHKMGIKAVEARRGYRRRFSAIGGQRQSLRCRLRGCAVHRRGDSRRHDRDRQLRRAKYYPLVKKVDIEFTAAARTDLRAEAALDEERIASRRNRSRRNGKADFTMDAVVRDEAGETVAVTRGLYQLRAHGK